MENIFQLAKTVNKLPFAASRQNWSDCDYVVVTRVVPDGNYGKAYGFAVHNDNPSDHLAYSSWKWDMELPNAGCYQWRVINLSDSMLKALVDYFYSGVAKRFGFTPPEVTEARNEQ